MEKYFNKRQIGLLKDVQLAQEVCELYYVQNLQSVGYSVKQGAVEVEFTELFITLPSKP